MFVHHLTRYAVVKAMREGYSPIYAGFYAYDETGHAFGPADASSRRILRHVDHTIRRVAAARRHGYELVVLSDHGQVETRPFRAENGKAFGEVLAAMLPGFHVKEAKGGAYGAHEKDAKGHVIATLSGGAAHLYFIERASRMSYADVSNHHPGLVPGLAALREVALVMLRDGRDDVFVTAAGEVRGPGVKPLLEAFDEPAVLYEQLSRLNSFAACGDVVVFGAFLEGKQVNFENQAGGHGSIGGEQLHPFVLARKELGLDVVGVTGAHQLHAVLSGLRDRLAASPP